MKFKQLLSLALVALNASLSAAEKPNIIFIFADDMGYGDVQILNPERGKILTPHMDQLAREGMVFTDAHTSSAVCTPSRYGLLTGRYSWRTHLQEGVVWGFSPPLITDDRLTVGELLQENGYKTAMIGKWHLGMTMPTPDGVLPVGRKPKSLNILWDGVIKDGPADRGFDYFWGISASLDMEPYIYIENDRFMGEIKQDGKSRTAKGFSRVDVLPDIGRKTVEYIGEQDGEQPFFVYVPLTSPHTPIVPSKEWVGKSGIGKYGDFQMQTDAIIGQIVDAVDTAGLKENTLIIVSSDNGCSRAANFNKLEAQGHFPSAHLRGSKADLWEGGHRVPFIVRWPEVIDAGSQSDVLIGLTDFLATCADIVGADIPAGAAEDSVSFLPAFTGQPIETARTGIVHHSISGHFAYRSGKWKLLLARGSGGWSGPDEKSAPKDGPEGQLYDMEADPSETTNLYETHPEIVERLLAQIETIVYSGRSTPGDPSSNDVEDAVIKLWKNK
ncbi:MULTISPECIES: arylsulfatase [unclassified Lentimonas]|uniref:sulfatase family protein n=1 Tax=unclassified Lentimonas TaxID=2630993 RepID=UPI001323EFA4|nr:MULTISPECIES: arylsulfatase [unclassified Lentimonas]CAA6677796.1 Choline-sulfatase (EC [Lentimonas sp. CC4]CAA6683898.1 Choline-sulfatase (EC [Lentimonas sp. CC6]CAA7076724.1 Choline-sulfatase (EC [Lentimonas sp. CC4]CAA7169941.1 Choline-sulfatase (EC [Lentimonas sp. CC21]CAA7181230.1 Choline-sulfatase (EC [Lentimonas sp. CC8]